MQGTATGNVKKGRKSLSPEGRFSQTGSYYIVPEIRQFALNQQDHSFSISGACYEKWVFLLVQTLQGIRWQIIFKMMTEKRL